MLIVYFKQTSKQNHLNRCEDVTLKPHICLTNSLRFSYVQTNNVYFTFYVLCDFLIYLLIPLKIKYSYSDYHHLLNYDNHNQNQIESYY